MPSDCKLANPADKAWETVSLAQIELTSRCNFNCKFCPSGVLERPHCDMPREWVLKILKELRDKSVIVLFHILGGPTLNKFFL